jgi:hypothetical protein
LRKKGMTPKDVFAGMEDFKRAMGTVLLERQQEALWFKLCWLKKRKGFNWQSGRIVATVGASITFMSVRRDVFPCVTPQMCYVVLEDGIPKEVDGRTLLAMQGIQKKEFHQFGLHHVKQKPRHLPKDGLKDGLRMVDINSDQDYPQATPIRPKEECTHELHQCMPATSHKRFHSSHPAT